MRDGLALAEILMTTSRQVYPIDGNHVEPATQMPDESRRMLCTSLAECPNVRQISGFLLYSLSPKVERQLSFWDEDYLKRELQQSLFCDDSNPVDNHIESINLRKEEPALLERLERDPENTFVGPLMIQGRYQPLGLGIWKIVQREV